MDIGGGSVEVVLTSDGLLIDSKSYDVGTVRMLQVLSDKRRGKERFAQVVEEVCGDVRRWVTGIVGHNLIGRMVGTGGNVEAIGDLTGRRAGKKAMSYANIKDIDREPVRLLRTLACGAGGRSCDSSWTVPTLSIRPPSFSRPS